MENEIFSVEIREYVVSINHDGDYNLVINNNQIVKNGNEIKNNLEEKISKIKNIIILNKSKIETLAGLKQSVIKGGPQKYLNIEFDGNKYRIVGNNGNIDVANFYISIKEEIIKVVNE